MADFSRTFDVLVVGGGNAGLCAALSAREAGANVLVLESAPRSQRGGNSRHTRNLRCMHDAPTDVLTDAYPEEEYFEDLLKVTGGDTDEPLARLTIRASAACTDWMGARGVRFQPSLGGTLHLGACIHIVSSPDPRGRKNFEDRSTPTLAWAGTAIQRANGVVRLRAQPMHSRISTAPGWVKTIAGQAKTRFRGLARVGWSFQLAAAAYNPIRLPKLLEAAS